MVHLLDSPGDVFAEMYLWMMARSKPNADSVNEPMFLINRRSGTRPPIAGWFTGLK